MKPDWKYAPDWAQWLAMDGDGMWSWFSEKPEWDFCQNDWFIPFPDFPDGEAEYACDVPDCDGVDWGHAWDTREQREVPEPPK